MMKEKGVLGLYFFFPEVYEKTEGKNILWKKIISLDPF
jgi:hypothetical protein